MMGMPTPAPDIASCCSCANPPRPLFLLSEPDQWTPLSPNNILRRQILPALNRCKTCAKPEDDHTSQSHAFERDNSLPLWIGWHGFRRSLSARLYEQKEQDRNIQAVMGHADVRTTMAHYIKPVLGSMERFSENEAKRTGQTSVQ
jgi:integrase